MNILAQMKAYEDQLIEPNQGRQAYLTVEWEIIKDAIDSVRSSTLFYDTDAVITLQGYDLWDYDNNCIDEYKVTRLYREYC